MGRISYMLYLIHELFVEWCMIDFYGHYRRRDRPLHREDTFDQQNDLMSDDQIPHEVLVLYNFLIFTPLLILTAWLLTWLVDTPSKDFSYELDIELRMFKPKAKKVGEAE